MTGSYISTQARCLILDALAFSKLVQSEFYTQTPLSNGHSIAVNRLRSTGRAFSYLFNGAENSLLSLVSGTTLIILFFRGGNLVNTH